MQGFDILNIKSDSKYPIMEQLTSINNGIQRILSNVNISNLNNSG